MFGNRERIQELEAEVARLRNDPLFQLAQQVASDIRGGAYDANIAEQVDAGVARMHHDLTQAEVARQIKEYRQKREEQIAKNAVERAKPIAAAAIEQFEETEAAKLLEEETARIAAQSESRYVAMARKRIIAEAAGKRFVSAYEQLVAEEWRPETREELKARAASLREVTKPRQYLEFSMLQPADQLTIALTSAGKGKDPLNDYDSWSQSSSYRSYLEARRLTVSVLEPETGLCSIEKDFMQARGNEAGAGFRVGTELYVSSVLPDRPIPSETLNGIVRGEPLSFSFTDNRPPVTTYGFEAWWVDLGTFKVLS